MLGCIVSVYDKVEIWLLVGELNVVVHVNVVVASVVNAVVIEVEMLKYDVVFNEAIAILLVVRYGSVVVTHNL